MRTPATGGQETLHGFADPVRDAQHTFRLVLKAMAEPGIRDDLTGVVGTPLPPVMTAIALTLLDFETPVFLAGAWSPHVPSYLAFRTGAPITQASERAAVILASSSADIPWNAYAVGTAEYPDRSATILVAVGDGDGDTAVELSGPGIAGARRVSVSGLDATFWRNAQENAAQYPLGADFIFCAPSSVLALPRSTAIRIVME